MAQLVISYAQFIHHLSSFEDGPEILAEPGVKNLDESFVVQWDSRVCDKQSLFVALRGMHADGHTFIDQAYGQGCRAFLVQQNWVKAHFAFFKKLMKSALCIVVNDVRASLFWAAKQHRASLQALRIGITGSVGKTSVKEWIKTITGMQYNVVATQGNLNTPIAIAARILSLSEETDIFICELGIDIPGEMQTLVDLVLPHLAIITTIGSAHIGNFASQEELAYEKTQILSRLAETAREIPKLRVRANLPTAWVPRQDAYMNLFKTVAQDVSVSQHLDTACWDNDSTDAQTGKMQFQGDIENHKYIVVLNTQLDIYPLTIAIAVAQSIGVLPRVIQEAISQGIELSGRGNIITIPKGIVIHSAYNASYESMMGALIDLAKRSHRNHSIAILAPMNELGDHADFYHAKVLRYLADSSIQDVILIGAAWKPFIADYAAYHFVDTCDEALAIYNTIVQENQVVLLKGSRSYALEQLLDGLTLQNNPDKGHVKKTAETDHYRDRDFEIHQCSRVENISQTPLQILDSVCVSNIFSQAYFGKKRNNL